MAIVTGLFATLFGRLSRHWRGALAATLGIGSLLLAESRSNSWKSHI